MGTGTPRHHVKGRERLPCGTPEEARATLAKRFEERPSDLARLMEAARYGAWVGAQIAWLAKSLRYLERINAALAKAGPPPEVHFDGAKWELLALLCLGRNRPPEGPFDSAGWASSCPITLGSAGTAVACRPPTGPESLAVPQTVFSALLVAYHLTHCPGLATLAPLRQSPLGDELAKLSDARIPMAAATLTAARRMGCKVRLGPSVLRDFSVALGLEKGADKRMLFDSWRKKMPAIEGATHFFDESPQAE